MTTSPAGAAVSRRPRPRARRSWWGLVYTAPAVLVFLAFLGIPLLQGAWYSLWNWDGFTAATWAGFSNYTRMLQDPVLADSFSHVVVLVFFYAVLPVVIGLALTMFISRSIRLRGIGVFRTLLFLPQVIASVVVASTWVAIYSPDGLLNQILRGLGLGAWTKAWLGDFTFALPAVGLIGTWLGVGLCMVLFLSGVASIDTEVFEAARLDGAGMFREFFSVTLPALRGQIAVALTLTVTGAVKTFDLIYITTRGGPGHSTTVPAYEAYSAAFQQREVGQGAAIGIVITLIVLAATLIIGRLNPKDAE